MNKVSFKNDFIKELETIQEHRRKNWKRQWGTVDTFVDFGEEARYQEVSRLIAFLRVMTDAEFSEVSKRADQSLVANSVQQSSLF